GGGRGARRAAPPDPGGAVGPGRDGQDNRSHRRARVAGRPPGPARPPPAGQSAWAATLGGRAGGGALRLAQGHPGRRAGGPGGGRGGGGRPGPPLPGGPEGPRPRRPAPWRFGTTPTVNRPSTCDFVCTQPSGNDILLRVPLEGRGFRVCS